MSELVSELQKFKAHERFVRSLYGQPPRRWPYMAECWPYMVVDEAGREVTLEEAVQGALETLPDLGRWKRHDLTRMLKLKFGLEDGRARSLREVGTVFGISRERVRQLEHKMLLKLRHPSRSRLLVRFGIPPFEEEIQRLEERVDELRRQNEQLQEENAELRKHLIQEMSPLGAALIEASRE